MKFIPLLLFLFLGFSTSFILLRPEITSPSPISQFFEGLYAHFSLPAPQEMVQRCFDPFTEELFFKTLYGTNEILLDVNARQAGALHWDFIKQMVRSFLERPATFCTIKSDEFTELLNALGVDNTEEWDLANWLYYQAHYQQLAYEFEPLIENLENGNYTEAGDAYAVVLKNFVDRTKAEGMKGLALRGFFNGFAIGLDIANPSDSLAVWNDTTAGYLMEFVEGVTEAISHGEWDHAYDSLHNFWMEKGKELLEKIPGSVWEGLKKSGDYQSLTSRLGMELAGKEFRYLGLKFIGKKSLRVFLHMKVLEKNLKDFQMLHSGIVVGALVNQIIQSQKP